MRISTSIASAVSCYARRRTRYCLSIATALSSFGTPGPSASSGSAKLDLVIPEDLSKRHWAAFHEAIRTGTTHYGTGNTLAVRAMRKDGSAIAVEFSMLPFRGDDGAILGIPAIMRDIRKRAGIIGAYPDWMNF